MQAKTFLVLALLFNVEFLFSPENSIAFAAERAPADPTFHEALVTGLHHVANNRFHQALAVFDSLERAFPQHPAPNFHKAATYQSWMLTYRFNKFQNELYENANLAIEKGTKLLETKDDPWLNFYVGAAYGYKALHRFRQHNWIGAYFDGAKGIRNFTTALEKLPELYDCYYGFGSYNYWRTAKSKFIRTFIFWMEDKRELGLAQFRLSIEKGRYCGYEATHGLMIAYFHYGDYAKALALNDTAMQFSHPPPLGTLYLRGRLMIQLKKWPEVQAVYQALLDQIVAQPFQSISYQVECKYWIAEALTAQNQTERAYQLAASALAQSESWMKGNELENPFESFEEIQVRLRKLCERLQAESNRPVSLIKVY
jgi:tetratricopeptide (TPR) repeat protein